MKNKKIGMVNTEDFQQGIKKALAGTDKKARSGWAHRLLFSTEKNNLNIVGCSDNQIAVATMDIDGGEVETCRIFLALEQVKELQEFLSLQICEKVTLYTKREFFFTVGSLYAQIELKADPDINYPNWKGVLKTQQEACFTCGKKELQISIKKALAENKKIKAVVGTTLNVTSKGAVFGDVEPLFCDVQGDFSAYLNLKRFLSGVKVMNNKKITVYYGKISRGKVFYLLEDNFKFILLCMIKNPKKSTFKEV